MNIRDLEKEKEAVNQEIIDFRERSRTGRMVDDPEAWVAEEKRLLAKRDEVNKKLGMARAKLKK